MMDTMTLGRSGFGIGRVIGLTFGVLRRNLLAVVLIAVVTYGLRDLILVFGTSLVAASAAGGTMWPLKLARYVVEVLFNSFLVGALSVLAFGDLAGQQGGLGTAMRGGLRTLLPMIALNLVLAIGIVLCTFLLIVPGIIVTLRWFVATPVRAIEGPGLQRALARSAELTRGYRWKLLGLVLIYGLAAVPVYGGPFWMALSGVRGFTVAGFGGVAILTGVAAAVLGTMYALGSAVVYSELRRVADGGLTNELAAVFE